MPTSNPSTCESAMSIPRKKLNIAKEQADIVALISELENSVCAVKEQINALTVETLQLKYMALTNNPKAAGIMSPRHQSMPTAKADFSLKSEPRRDSQEEEESD